RSSQRLQQRDGRRGRGARRRAGGARHDGAGGGRRRALLSGSTLLCVDRVLYYRAADVFVCTSRLECYPRVTQEAMAFGLPLVTSPVFGIFEQVRHGINGLFYEPGRPDQLAEALTRLLVDDRLRQWMGSNAPVVLRGLNGFD